MKKAVVMRNRPSNGAKVISVSLGLKRAWGTKPLRRKFPEFGTIINWGCTELPVWHRPTRTYINHPSRVFLAVNKRTALDRLSAEGVPCLEHTSLRNTALEWLEQGHKVYARTMLTASAGRGIVVVTGDEPLPNCGLYTKGFYDKHYEFRVHVAGGQVRDYVQKKQRRETDVNRDIRSHENGYVYCHDDLIDMPSVREAALAAIKTLGLDFAAVDVLAHQGSNTVAVAEVNTAPGLECTVTKAAYVNYFKEKLGYV